MKTRTNSYVFCGGAFGDEGKGRIVDEYVSKMSKKKKIVVYRDNGGANAGHTVTLPSGERVALHQLPSGIFSANATVILGKGMVIHPGDLLTELQEVARVTSTQETSQIFIDEMIVLSLDTHRAYEAALKMWQDGGKGSTGRGISPAYADVLLRQPLRARDLQPFNKKKITAHYELYEALLKGLGQDLATMMVPSLESSELHPVGTEQEFLQQLKAEAQALSSLITDVAPFLRSAWSDDSYGFVFEKAQAIGLDARWGVYPDITASNTALDGIFASTEGIIDHREIKVRAAVIKATYMSTVGTRVLPTMMEEKLAHQIREDAHEYGATTRRPRGIAYLDLPALSFYARVGDITHHVLTHMDIIYPDLPIKVCVAYELDGEKVPYRPDQEYLLKVKPVYREFKPWNKEKMQTAKSFDQAPATAKKFVQFLEKELGTKVLMVTTGPQRNQSLKLH